MVLTSGLVSAIASSTWLLASSIFSWICDFASSMASLTSSLLAFFGSRMVTPVSGVIEMPGPGGFGGSVDGSTPGAPGAPGAPGETGGTGGTGGEAGAG